VKAERSKRPIRVWVAGASGFTGRALTEALARSTGFEVHPHIRPRSSRLARLSAEWEALNLEPIVADWGSIEPHFARVQPDVVVCLLGVTKKQTKRGGGSYAEVDEGLTIQMVELTARRCPKAHVIYLSSQGAEWGRWSAYLRARMNVERALKLSSLRATIVRPGLLSGESRDERRPLEEHSATLTRALCHLLDRLRLSSIADRFRPLDAPELARVMLELSLSPHDPNARVQELDLSELHRRLRALERHETFEDDG